MQVRRECDDRDTEERPGGEIERPPEPAMDDPLRRGAPLRRDDVAEIEMLEIRIEVFDPLGKGGAPVSRKRMRSASCRRARRTSASQTSLPSIGPSSQAAEPMLKATLPGSRRARNHSRCCANDSDRPVRTAGAEAARPLPARSISIRAGFIATSSSLSAESIAPFGALMCSCSPSSDNVTSRSASRWRSASAEPSTRPRSPPRPGRGASPMARAGSTRKTPSSASNCAAKARTVARSKRSVL